MDFQQRMSRTVNAEHWKKLINEWRASGLSQKQFCQECSLALSTFCYWKSKFNNPEPTSPRFYPLTIPSSPSEQSDAGLILCIGSKKFQIQIQKEFSQTTLTKLISTLEQL